MSSLEEDNNNNNGNSKDEKLWQEEQSQERRDHNPLNDIMPLPQQDDKQIIDHRSGIPGAFGVGDVSHYLQETSDHHDEEPSQGGTDPENALVVADPVTATHRLQQAVPEETRRKTPFVLSARDAVLVLGGFLAAIAVLLGSLCGGGLCGKANQEIAPVAPVTTFRSNFKEALEAELKLLFGTGYFETGQLEDFIEARNKALEWIAFEDPMQLDIAADNLIQRYIMALFYYATTIRSPWNECNPPAENQDSMCFYENALREEDTGIRWLSELPECQWVGVMCASTVVYGIELESFLLNGRIPSELAGLTALSYLSLAQNQLSGDLPTDLVGLPFVEKMVLRRNNLTGSIPPWIFSSWRSLEWIDLSYNYFTGTLPDEIQEFNGRQLRLTSNLLTGSILSAIFSLANLEALELGHNEITGPFPTPMSDETSLLLLTLERTDISGSLPSEIARLTELTSLSLSHTKLKGAVPEALFSLTNLQELDLGDCAFSSTLSSRIGQLTSLNLLSLHNTNITGIIPPEISRVKSLGHFSIHGTSMSGNVPGSFCAGLYSFDQGRYVSADCWPDEITGVPKVQCSCCTDCCDATTGICHSL